MSLFLQNYTVPASPPGRTGHVSVSHGKSIYVWGGYKENPGSSNHTYFNGNELWVYNCVSEKWLLRICPYMFPPGMSGSAAIVINDCMYLFGGYTYNGAGCTNNLYRLELMTLEWRKMKTEGTPPIPVDKMVGWQHNDKLYIFGGFGNLNSGPLDDFQYIFYHMFWNFQKGWTNQFFKYDPGKQLWNRPVCTGTLPSARAAHAATVIHENVYIFGGRHDMNRLNDLHCLNMKTMHWSGEISVKGPVPEGRSWHTLTALVDEYLILYGGLSQNDIALSDCWMFNTKRETWQPLELPYQKPRVWHTASLTVFNEVLIYGGCKSNILDPNTAPDQTTDVIFIRISPKSLFRLNMDKLMEYPQMCMMWNCLPYSVQCVLHQRAGGVPPLNIVGS